MRGTMGTLNALGFDFQEVAAKLQSWAGQFMGTKAKLYDARTLLGGLVARARNTGYVEIGGSKFSLAQVTQMAQDNEKLLAENIDLERRFLSAMEELNTIRSVMDSGAEAIVGIPGIAGIGGLDAVPVAAIAWATGAAVLIGSIAYFMSRVKTHLDRLAGATAGSILGIGTIALLAGGAYLFFGRK